MRFFYTNLSDTATLAASSAATLLPVTNVQDSRSRNKWRTGATLTTEYIVGDMGSAKAVTSVIIHAHTLLAGDTNIKFQMNATDSWSSPSYSIDLTRLDKTFGAVFAAQTYRYFRFVFDKATAGSSRDVGRLFVGNYLQPTATPDFGGLNINPVDSSETTQSLGEDDYSEIRNFHDEIVIPVGLMNDTDRGNLYAYFKTTGIFTPHFVQIEASGYSTFYYARFMKAPKFDIVGLSGNYLWKTTLEYREQVS
jgi:hypothetical protein